jgi:hypothetical protein
MPQFHTLMTAYYCQKEGASDSEPTENDIDMRGRLLGPCPEVSTIIACIICLKGRKKLVYSKYYYVTSAAYGISKSSVYMICREANTW